MLARKALSKMREWKNCKSHSALLVTGARQVGKTYLVRKFAKAEYDNFAEVNFIDNPHATKIFSKQLNHKEILSRLSLIIPEVENPNNTLIFFDEIQECPDIMTSIKFLVDNCDFDIALSGSLLGTELQDIRSVPVGYISEIEMYPLNFEEFCWSQNVSDEVYKDTMSHLFSKTPVDDFINNHFKELAYKYLVVGGMPDAICAYINTGSFASVRSIQNSIRTYYKKDISQYCLMADKLQVKETYDLIPSELNNPNKRFILKELNKKARFREYESAFVWLENAGVALATYNVTEPVAPLLASKQRNLFKLFYSDAGMLMSTYSNSTALKILSNENNIKCGAMYENFVAQELKAHGFNLFYYNNKKHGELDFIIETKDGGIYPIEVKSGKSYRRHRALSNILTVKNYEFKQPYVFGSDYIEEKDGIVYAPIYFVAALTNE